MHRSPRISRPAAGFDLRPGGGARWDARERCRFRRRIQDTVGRGRRWHGKRHGRRQWSAGASVARLRGDIADVAAAREGARAALHGHRARSAGHRRLVDTEDGNRHEDFGRARARRGQIARLHEGARGRSRHRADGRVRVCRDVPAGSREARVDGRVPAGCRRLGSHLQQSGHLALPLLRSDAGSAREGTRADILRALLERFRGRQNTIDFRSRSARVHAGVLASGSNGRGFCVFRVVPEDSGRFRGTVEDQAALPGALDRR